MGDFLGSKFQMMKDAIFSFLPFSDVILTCAQMPSFDPPCGSVCSRKTVSQDWESGAAVLAKLQLQLDTVSGAALHPRIPQLSSEGWRGGGQTWGLVTYQRTQRLKTRVRGHAPAETEFEIILSRYAQAQYRELCVHRFI